MNQRHDKESVQDAAVDALGRDRTAGGHASGEALLRFVAVMDQIRRDCAWNRLQTHESLARYIVEESYELVEAIEAGDDTDIAEELGDVLYSVLFHASIAEGRGAFTIDDVAERAAEKMIRRHPHVFAGIDAPTPDDVERVWEAVKAEEKAHRRSALDGLPVTLPALLLAEKMVGRARSVGVSAGEGTAVHSEADLGDALLALVVGAREAGLDPERALRTRLRALADEVRGAEGAGSAAGTD